ncbi:hypothetical protein [Nostoc sp. DedVER01b]|uniref:hypothetical protein n=1 Tax=Nostoc sp. DedVER01b TaxID=3075404 RepID=UPI002AD2AA9E|nr:hypothetical protein [Nostoc sp. DedVER01b]MDZ8114638.1 hypothetical protein [Nostoc sp. DedVER01b]
MNLCNFNATKVQGNAIKLLLKTTKVQANATKVQLGEQAFAHPTKLNFHKKSDVDVGWVEG